MSLAEIYQRGAHFLDERFPGWEDIVGDDLAKTPDLDNNWLSLLLRGESS